ncbi:MAG: hypothetical protein N2112_09185, partial [Gemmataceae bacterium]|nr:hypothetical protein [Gemmataceae bacterium]
MKPEDSQPDYSLSRRHFVGLAGAVTATSTVFAHQAIAQPMQDKLQKPAERESLKLAKQATKALEKTIIKISHEVSN